MPRSGFDIMWSETLTVFAPAERRQREVFQLTETGWEPPVDVLETEAGLLVIVALPGVRSRRHGNRHRPRRIAGQRNAPMAGLPEPARVHRIELPHGRFERLVAAAAGCLSTSSARTIGWLPPPDPEEARLMDAAMEPSAADPPVQRLPDPGSADGRRPDAGHGDAACDRPTGGGRGACRMPPAPNGTSLWSCSGNLWSKRLVWRACTRSAPRRGCCAISPAVTARITPSSRASAGPDRGRPCDGPHPTVTVRRIAEPDRPRPRDRRPVSSVA